MTDLPSTDLPATGLPTLADPDNDPFLWLEDIDGRRATAWADEQSRLTLERFGDARFAADRDTLRRLLDRPDNLPVPTRRGGLLYNFWKDADHPRGVWRRTTLDSYRTPAPDWDVLLDLDALAAAEAEDWIWQGAATLPSAHTQAMLRLSRGGSDAVVLREFDLLTRRFVADGFVLPEAKSSAAWLDSDTLLLSTALGGATTSGYPDSVRLWQRDSAWSEGPVLFRTDPANLGAWGDFDRPANRLIFVERTGFFDAKVWIGDRSGPKQLVDLPTDAWAEWEAGWLAVRARSAWRAGAATVQPDEVVVIRLDDFLAGDRRFTSVFQPAPRRAMQGFFWAAGRLVLSVLDDLRPVHLVLTPGDWQPVPLGGLPAIGTVSAWRLDTEAEESDGSLLAAAQDPVTPPSLLLTSLPPTGFGPTGLPSANLPSTARSPAGLPPPDLRPADLRPTDLRPTGLPPPDLRPADLPPNGAGLATPEILKRLPPAFDASGMVVTRHEAVSIDGERIPYVMCGPPGETGEAPVHLTAYGGFAVSSLPSYRIGAGKLWLERGGTTVLANIRGGGEFGTRWHEAGRRAGKRLSHDDFAAVAADLVRRGVTRAGRIAAEGGSNGGLLIANMLTRYPDRFGALFCTIPLIDMRRYSRLLAGASWIAEYGDPEKPEDWAFLGPMSAYHVAEPGRPYPPILLATSRRDDRVHPGHARKMAAKLQAMGYDASFYEPAAGGHGYGKDNAEVASFAALGMTFLRRAIGWEDGGGGPGG